MYKGENPIKGVKLPILQNQRERFLKYDEANTALERIKERILDQLHDMALLLFIAGSGQEKYSISKGKTLILTMGLSMSSTQRTKKPRKAFMTKAVKEMLQIENQNHLMNICSKIGHTEGR